MGWLFRILPSPTPRLDEHVSVWSVAARDAKTFFRIVGALWLAALGFAFYRKRDELPWDSGAGGPADQAWLDVGDFTFAVLADFGTVGIAITIVAMLLTRAVNKTGELLMSLYQFVVNRYVIPVIEGAQGRGPKSRAWPKLGPSGRVQAPPLEREGREFTEPTPQREVNATKSAGPLVCRSCGAGLAWLDVGDFIFAVALPLQSLRMLLTRAVNKTGELLMSLYQFVVNRYVIPVIEGHKAEGREEGRVEGREQGLAEARAEWQAWNERRLAAEREGREFIEPPPPG